MSENEPPESGGILVFLKLIMSLREACRANVVLFSEDRGLRAWTVTVPVNHHCRNLVRHLKASQLSDVIDGGLQACAAVGGSMPMWNSWGRAAVKVTKCLGVHWGEKEHLGIMVVSSL